MVRCSGGFVTNVVPKPLVAVGKKVQARARETPETGAASPERAHPRHKGRERAQGNLTDPRLHDSTMAGKLASGLSDYRIQSIVMLTPIGRLQRLEEASADL